MKPSKFLFTLIFLAILHFQPIQALESIKGTWSSPNILSETSDICCIPASITTKTTTENTITATYKYKENNEKCVKLFGGQDNTSLTLLTSEKDESVYVSEQESTRFNFKIDENSKLSIELIQYNSLNECKFTLTKDTGMNPLISLGVFTFISLILGCGLLYLRPKTADDDEDDLENNYRNAEIQKARASIILPKKYRRISSVIKIPMGTNLSDKL